MTIYIVSFDLDHEGNSGALSAHSTFEAAVAERDRLCEDDLAESVRIRLLVEPELTAASARADAESSIWREWRIDALVVDGVSSDADDADDE